MLLRRRRSPCAQGFINRLSGAAKPRVPALALGEELEITSDGFVGAALLYDDKICHLAAFGDAQVNNAR